MEVTEYTGMHLVNGIALSNNTAAVRLLSDEYLRRRALYTVILFVISASSMREIAHLFRDTLYAHSKHNFLLLSLQEKNF